MTLLERLNYKCDALAKSAVAYGIITCTETVSTSRHRLPLESVALFHDGVKISGECGREIPFQIGKVEAREFYITQLGCGMLLPSIMWIGNPATVPFMANQICSRCGCSSSLRSSALQGRIWVDGLVPNIPPAQIVTRQMKTLHIFCTVAILAVSASFDQKSTS
jgi:hypothetical protein